MAAEEAARSLMTLDMSLTVNRVGCRKSVCNESPLSSVVCSTVVSMPSGCLSRMRKALQKEPLLVAMLIAVILGVAGGALARGLSPSDRDIELLGKLFMRRLPVTMPIRQRDHCASNSPAACVLKVCWESS